MSYFADGTLKQFLEKSVDLAPEVRCKVLEDDKAVMAAHEAMAVEGQTEAPPRDKALDLHFVCFVHNDGKLYELGTHCSWLDRRSLFNARKDRLGLQDLLVLKNLYRAFRKSTVVI